MAGSLEVGDRAPDFTLSESREEKLSLSDVLKEKNAVLAFYFLAFSNP
jgi:peroxiredoxin